MTKERVCWDCGKPISYSAIRCRSCDRKVKMIGHCPDCGAVTIGNKKDKLCDACNRQRMKSWRDAHKKTCVDCGKTISYSATRCHTCVRKARKEGKLDDHIIGKPKVGKPKVKTKKCVDCGALIGDFSTRCIKCFYNSKIDTKCIKCGADIKVRRHARTSNLCQKCRDQKAAKIRKKYWKANKDKLDEKRRLKAEEERRKKAELSEKAYKLWLSDGFRKVEVVDGDVVLGDIPLTRKELREKENALREAEIEAEAEHRRRHRTCPHCGKSHIDFPSEQSLRLGKYATCKECKEKKLAEKFINRCRYCSRLFTPEDRRKKGYCSEECYKKAMTTDCKYCGKPFLKKHHAQRFCSQECKWNSWRKMPKAQEVVAEERPDAIVDDMAGFFVRMETAKELIEPPCVICGGDRKEFSKRYCESCYNEFGKRIDDGMGVLMDMVEKQLVFEHTVVLPKAKPQQDSCDTHQNEKPKPETRSD